MWGPLWRKPDEMGSWMPDWLVLWARLAVACFAVAFFAPGPTCLGKWIVARRAFLLRWSGALFFWFWASPSSHQGRGGALEDV